MGFQVEGSSVVFLGSRVQDSRFRVKEWIIGGLRFRFYTFRLKGSGFKGCGVGFRVYGSMFTV